MASENPYQSPPIPAELLEPSWPAAGVYRDGNYLVLHHGTNLPPICLKTRLPAETHIVAELAGGLPNDGSVPATRKKWYGDKVYAVQVPFSQQALRTARIQRRVGLTIAALLVLGLAGVLLGYEHVQRWGIAENLPGVFILGIILSIAFVTEARHHLRLECVARGYFWIANVPKKYLRQLPEWPVPRPSFWRRAFFGPAGVGGPKSVIRAELADGN